MTSESSCFVRSSASTYVDQEAGLQWVAFAIGQSLQDQGGYSGDGKLFSWKQLDTLIEKLNNGKGFAGYRDWRIPTAAELQALIEADVTGLVVALDDSLEFWSATDAGDSNALLISRNTPSPVGKPHSYKAAIRLVRPSSVISEAVVTKPSQLANITSYSRTLTDKLTANADHAIQHSRAAVEGIKEKGQSRIKEVGLDQHAVQAREKISLLRLFWTRVLKSDFHVVRASNQESETLISAEQPVTSPIAQDYSSWRRSLLMISLLGLSFGLLFMLIDMLVLFRTGVVTWIIHFQGVALFSIQIATTILCVIAARSWADLPKSRSFARLAWLVQFVLPLLIFMLPFSLLINDQLILAQIGLAALLALAPKIFGLFPGLIRCSLTMKTLLPESSVPGWLGLLIAPFYALLLLVVAIVALQMAEVFLAVGLVMMSIGMGVVILRSQLLLEPQGQEEASASVKRIKQQQMIFQIVGIALIGIFALKHAELEVGWLSNLIYFAITFIANVTLLTVVMSDFLLAMIYKARQQATSFSNTDKALALDIRLSDLSACGLTELEAGEAEFAAGMRSKGGVLADKAVSHRKALSEKLKRNSASS